MSNNSVQGLLQESKNGSDAHSPEILRAEGVTRKFGGLVAVDVDELVIPTGKITSMIGPNGAGKSTFFNIVTGFDRPQSGRWTFDGEDITGRTASRVARLGMVRTFQLTKTLETSTLVENVKLGAQHQRGEHVLLAPLRRLWRRQETELEARARDMLERFNLSHLADSPAGVLSGGQRKLLELARAMMSEPKLLMMDEPMAGVNPVLREALLEQIRNIQEQGTTVLLIEHDMDFVKAVSDHVICLASGQVIAKGSAEEVTSSQQVIDAYLGDRSSTVGLSNRKRELPEPSRSGEPLFRADDIVAGYVPGVDILRGCSLDVFDGEIVGIFGPNGAGKSTLMKALYGRAAVRAGDFSLEGGRLNEVPDYRLTQKGIGYVSQLTNVFPRLTVEENLRMGVYADPSRWSRRISEITDIFPLVGQLFKNSAGDLSGGERQIVALARAMMMSPRLLMLDEPSAGLSPVMQTEIFQQICNLNDIGVSVLIVEQNARQCLEICDRGYVLDQGVNAHTGTGQQLLSDPTVIELYLGSLGAESQKKEQ